jgi:uncharacterized membrane protein YraQ (UPF0718 family)
MTVLVQIAQASWDLFVEAAPYLIFGVLVAGLMYLFLAPETIAKHLGSGRVRSVFKAALLGIPLPLCSCGVAGHSLASLLLRSFARRSQSEKAGS